MREIYTMKTETFRACFPSIEVKNFEKVKEICIWNFNEEILCSITFQITFKNKIKRTFYSLFMNNFWMALKKIWMQDKRSQLIVDKDIILKIKEVGQFVYKL